MKRVMLFALAVLFCSTLASADDGKHGVSITFNSDDPNTVIGPRRNVHEAKLAITTKDGSTALLLMNDVVAVQLTDKTIANVKAKDDDSFLEELLASGVQVMLKRAVEYPIAHIRAVELRDGVLTMMNDRNQPLFTDVKINGANVLRSFSPADAARFVNAFRAARSATGH
jgi:hypothetical protein